MHDFRIAHGATELLFIRHGDAEHPTAPLNDDPKTFDLPLTPRGRRQAQALSERLAQRSIDAIYSSPLRRTRETADIVAAALKLAVLDDARLREVEIAGAGPVALQDLAEIALAHGGWSHLAGTESSASIRGRMREAVEAILASCRQQRVAVISHAGAINAYICSLLDLKGDFFFPAGNTSISIVRARDDRRLLVSLNDIAHLERMT
jgi:2,3-bisphosphoglycerate-dependent phosphoglycerate mutase